MRLSFEFEGTVYEISIQVWMLKHILLPDGTLLLIDGWTKCLLKVINLRVIDGGVYMNSPLDAARRLGAALAKAQETLV